MTYVWGKHREKKTAGLGARPEPLQRLDISLMDGWEQDLNAAFIGLIARAEKAEAQIQAVRDVCDSMEAPLVNYRVIGPVTQMHAETVMGAIKHVRQALDGA